MNVADRIIQMAEENNLSQAKMGAIIGKTRGYLNAASTKDSSVGSDILSKIIDEFPEYNIEWVITGKGEKLKKDIDSYGGAAEGRVLYTTNKNLSLEERFQLFSETTNEKLDVMNQKLNAFAKLKNADMEILKTLIENIEQIETKS